MDKELLEMTKESQKTNTMTAEETARQNSFIELAKTLTAQKSNTLGRPLTYCLTTFGCQMNEKQSEVVAGIMDEIGYHRQDNEEADVVIYNTCTVRENANLKVYGRLGHLHSLKDKNPDMKIIPISARTGEGMDEWIDWLKEETSSWNESNEKGVKE
jgi:tRNA-2-methylthio-N6-dimethylallyladenosine synthase